MKRRGNQNSLKNEDEENNFTSNNTQNNLELKFERVYRETIKTAVKIN